MDRSKVLILLVAVGVPLSVILTEGNLWQPIQQRTWAILTISHLAALGLFIVNCI